MVSRAIADRTRIHRYPTIDLSVLAAVILDTDGVVTDTAAAHAQAWKQVLDAYLRRCAARDGTRFEAFDIRADYLYYVDGRPRVDGARGFLAGRGIEADEETLERITAAKDAVFLRQIGKDGVAAFPSTVALLRELRRCGARTAAVSADRHCAEALAAAGVAGMFDVRVDGIEAATFRLPGKPHPALYLEAAHRLGVPPAHAGVVEDTLAGLEAGRRGGFGLVLGVDHRGEPEAQYAHGANSVVSDLREVWIIGRRTRR